MSATQNQGRTSDAKSKLASIGAKKAKKPAEQKTRPELKLSPAQEHSFVRFIEADAVAELAKERVKQERATLDPSLLSSWIDTLWKTKNQPANPALEVKKNGVVDISGLFQVQERFKLNKPEVPEGTTLAERLIETLTDLYVGTGVPEEEAEVDAARLINEEIDFTPKKQLRSWNELLEGHYEGAGKERTFVVASDEDMNLAEKALKLLQCRDRSELADEDMLTDEEFDSLNEEKDIVMVKAGFLKRICTYVKSLDQLRAIFTIIKPVCSISSKKFAKADTPEEQNRRKLAAAVDILGIQMPAQ
jgi:hypothetical protein